MYLFKIEQRFSTKSIFILKQMIGSNFLWIGMENAQIKMINGINSFSSIECIGSMFWVYKTKESEQKRIKLEVKGVFPFNVKGKSIDLDDSSTGSKEIKQLKLVSIFLPIINLADSIISKIEVYHHFAQYKDASIKKKVDHYFLKNSPSAPSSFEGITDVFDFWTYLIFYFKKGQFIIIERADFDCPDNLCLYFSDTEKMKYIKTHINDDIKMPMFKLVNSLKEN